MRFLTWNIQYGQGADRALDLSRTIETIRSFGHLDVISLQEVARHFPEYCTAEYPDQLVALARAFPHYTPVWGSGMSWWGGGGQRQEFGNLTLVAGRLVDYRVHLLPRPPGAGCKQIPRVAVEAVVAASERDLRLINVHLAYHNDAERLAQVQHLIQLQHWYEQAEVSPPQPGPGSYGDRYRTPITILCGDCNFTPADDEYLLFLQAGWRDAWRLAHGSADHDPSCGVHDRDLWPIGPHCRDFFWLSSGLADASCKVWVAGETACSDHQPVLLDLPVSCR